MNMNKDRRAELSDVTDPLEEARDRHYINHFSLEKSTVSDILVQGWNRS